MLLWKAGFANDVGCQERNSGRALQLVKGVINGYMSSFVIESSLL